MLPLFTFFYLLGSFLLGLVIYSETFLQPFHFDDFSNIVHNTALQNDFSSMQTFTIHQPSRFIGFLTFALNYHANGLNVFGYHLVNFLIHVINSLLVWWLVKLILSKGTLKYSGIDQNSRFIPIFTSLIFLVHPIATQSVSYISQRFTSLAALFYLGSLCFYIKARLTKTYRISLPLSMVLALLGMFTKEFVMTLPFSIILYELFFQSGTHTSLFTKKYLKIKYLITGLILICFILIIPKFSPYAGLGRFWGYYASESHLGDILTFKTYVLTQLRVLGTFLKLFILPFNQNLDYDFPMSHSLIEPMTTLLSLCILIAILAVGIKLRQKNPLISFGIFWFFLTMAPNFVPRVHVIFEHQAYLPLIGFALCLASIITYFIKWPLSRIAFSGIVLVFFSILTFQRNQIWENDVTLYQDIVKKSPNKPRPHLNLGEAYLNKEEYTLALAEFNRTIELNPEYDEAYNNRGMVFMLRKEFSPALEDFNKAIALNPRKDTYYINRGNLFQRLGEFEKALENYNLALDFNSSLEKKTALIYHNRGTIYLRMAKYELALQDFNEVLKLQPDFVPTYMNRAELFMRLKENKKAIEDYTKVIDIQPQGKAYYNRSVLFWQEGKFQQALQDALKAREQGYPIKDEYFRQLKDQINFGQ